MSDPASAARFQRASALEEKRRKLEELKQKRQVRSTDTARLQATQTSTNLDDYIDDLLKDSTTTGSSNAAAGAGAAATSSAAAAVTVGTDSNVTSNIHQNENGTSIDTSTTTTTTTTTSSSSSSSSSYHAVETLRKQIEMFSISTQTEDDEDDEGEDAERQDDEQKEDLKDPKKNDDELQNQNDTIQTTKANHKKVALVLPKVLSSPQVETEVTKPPFTLFLHSASKKVERMLLAQQQEHPMDLLLADYVSENKDIDRNNQNSSDMNHTDDPYHHHYDTKLVSSKVIYECPKWTNHRDVTDLDWSPIHRELLLSTYHNIHGVLSTTMSTTSTTTTVDLTKSRHVDTLSSSLTPRSGELLSDGLVLIWSPLLPNRPEHVFTCGSPVTSGKFHPTDPTLILGGCESGQLVLWDIRSGRLPVQKSSIPTAVLASSSSSSSISGSTNPMPLKGHHAHAIGSMDILDGGLSLVTASADGRLNFWSMTNLRDPAESIQVGDSISCVAVLPESETLVVGDEHGTMYTVATPNSSTSANSMGMGDTTTTASGKNSPVPSSAAISSGGGQRVSRRQVKKMDMSGEDDNHLGHFGMITSISAKLRSSMKSNNNSSNNAHTGTTSKGFFRGIGGLLVSSGVDWTVKLWGPAYHSDKPLMSYVSHSYDYMSDVAWSPTHPSLFATASSNGSVGLWNLATSLDEPMTGPEGILVQPDAMSSGVGLNKIKWSADGRRLAVASSDKVHVLHLADDVTRTKGDEETKVMNQLLSRGLI